MGSSVLRGIATTAGRNDVRNISCAAARQRDLVISRRVSSRDRLSAIGALVIVTSKEGSPLAKGERALRSSFPVVVLQGVVAVLLGVLSDVSKMAQALVLRIFLAPLSLNRVQFLAVRSPVDARLELFRFAIPSFHLGVFLAPVTRRLSGFLAVLFYPFQMIGAHLRSIFRLPLALVLPRSLVVFPVVPDSRLTNALRIFQSVRLNLRRLFGWVQRTATADRRIELLSVRLAPDLTLSDNAGFTGQARPVVEADLWLRAVAA